MIHHSNLLFLAAVETKLEAEIVEEELVVEFVMMKKCGDNNDSRHLTSVLL